MDGAFDEGWNANDVPERSFDPIPEDDYTLAVVDSEVKQNSAGTGRFLCCKIEVVDGPLKGRLLWVYFNLWNPNQQAVQFARADFAALCRACRVPKVNDSRELHGIVFSAHVGLKKNKDDGEVRNEIKKYMVSGGSPNKTAPNGGNAPAGNATGRNSSGGPSSSGNAAKATGAPWAA